MKIEKDIIRMQQLAADLRRQGKIIGLVPTMGFLHEGHLSLMRNLRPRCDILVVSIFVNPLQFGLAEDLARYPRDFSRDEKLCRLEKVDIIFYPHQDQMYQKPYHTYVNVEKLTRTLCGNSRPGHFQGVATIVTKLFNIVQPHLAIFGQKDYQQARVIQQMVRDLNFDVEITITPVIREPSGLALSSRNQYLDPEERGYAVRLFHSLQLAQRLVNNGLRDAEVIKKQIMQFLSAIPGGRIDYIEIVDLEVLEPLDIIKGKALIALAVYIGKTRLIDNMIVG